MFEQQKGQKKYSILFCPNSVTAFYGVVVMIGSSTLTAQK